MLQKSDLVKRFLQTIAKKLFECDLMTLGREEWQ